MGKTESYKRAYSFIILIMFSFGAAMTLLYLPLLEEMLSGKEKLPIVMSLVLLFIVSFLAASVNGVVIIPGLDILFGCAIAFVVDDVRENFCVGEAFAFDLILICVLLPVYFTVSVWGMKSSSQIRTALSGQGFDLEKISALAYFIVLVGFASLAGVQVMMFI